VAAAGLCVALAGCSRSTPSFVMSPIVQVAAAATTIQNPALAVDNARHRVYVAWSVYPKDSAGLNYLAVSTDDGDTFGAPIHFGGTSSIQQPELRVIDDGTLFVVWTHVHDDAKAQTDYAPSEQRLIKSHDGGQTFSTPVVISGQPESPMAYFMAMAVTPDGRTVTVAWFDYNFEAAKAAGRNERDAAAFYTRTSHDGGATFGPIRRTADAICVCCSATGIVRDNRPAFVLRGFRAGGATEGDVRDPTIIASSDQGDHWNAPITIHQDNFRLDACPHLGPGAAVDGTGRVHVTWWTGATGRAGYWYATSDDGIAFSKPLKLADQATDMHGNDLSVSVDGRGTAWATAVASAPVRREARAEEDTPLGVVRLWAIPRGEKPISVDQITVDGVLPVVAAARSGAFVVWVDGSKIFLRRVEAQG